MARTHLINGRGILVTQQREIRQDPGAKPRQGQVPVEPPPRVLVAEQQHQHRRHKHGPARAERIVRGIAAALGPGDQRQDDADGNDREQPEEGRQSEERPRPPVAAPARLDARELGDEEDGDNQAGRDGKDSTHRVIHRPPRHGSATTRSRFWAVPTGTLKASATWCQGAALRPRRISVPEPSTSGHPTS